MRKMKKSIAMVGLLSVLLTGCAKNDSDKELVLNEENSTVYDDLANKLNDQTAEIDESEEMQDASEAISSTEGVDVDLTQLSSTMVFAEVYNMVSNPGNYIGKTVRMAGPYNKSYFEETGMYYHFIIIEDAGACCTSGIEFKSDRGLENNLKDQENVEVTGVFRSYEEAGRTYFYLEAEEVKTL